ncbi:MAG: Rieske (2Fe-2S) protein [Flavobacteriaceae bacterium]
MNNFTIIITRLLLAVGVLTTLQNCNKTSITRNPYISNVGFDYQVNLNLPQYDDLRFVGGSAYVYQAGLKGVLIFNLNGRNFLAWEATCPNHIPRECSLLQLRGTLAECSCEGFQYSLANGQLLNPSNDGSTPYPLINYRAEVFDSFLYLSN